MPRCQHGRWAWGAVALLLGPGRLCFALDKQGRQHIADLILLQWLTFWFEPHVTLLPINTEPDVRWILVLKRGPTVRFHRAIVQRSAAAAFGSKTLARPVRWSLPSFLLRHGAPLLRPAALAKMATSLGAGGCGLLVHLELCPGGKIWGTWVCFLGCPG